MEAPRRHLFRELDLAFNGSDMLSHQSWIDYDREHRPLDEAVGKDLKHGRPLRESQTSINARRRVLGSTGHRRFGSGRMS